MKWSGAVVPHFVDDGSTASRRASPMKFVQMTRMMMRMPGLTHNQGMPVRTEIDSAPFKRLPRLACGGCTPMPRKECAASSRMEMAMTLVAKTRIGAIVFDRISEKRPQL